jgi:aminoglycoside phosphotransferase (APT) family kinase protein
VGLNEPATREALERYVVGRTGAANVITHDLTPLAGGAVQENWAWDLTLEGGRMSGDLAAVIRTDAVSRIPESLTRAQEFAVLEAAADAGVTVPEPLWLCADEETIGRPFYVMRRIAGTAAGHRIVRETDLGGDREALIRTLGAELAKIHSIRPPREDLDFLVAPDPDPARFSVAKFQDYLDALPEVYPALQWGLSWADLHAPDPTEPLVLTHHDYRTGNLMVDEYGLTGILDWEFAGWSERHEDIGWFCAKCWRFGADDKEAGGIGSREAFYEGYRSHSGLGIDAGRVHYWEVMANVRWAILALQQAQRHLSGEEKSLELALTGRIVPELELEILMLTEEYDEGRVG